MDIVVYLLKVGGAVKISIEYNTDLFNASTIEKMIGHYIEIMEQVIRDMAVSLGDLILAQNTLDIESNIPQEKYMDFKF